MFILLKIKYGKKTERHLCQHCAATAAGVPTDTGIEQLLRRFVEEHSKPKYMPDKERMLDYEI